MFLCVRRRDCSTAPIIGQSKARIPIYCLVTVRILSLPVSLHKIGGGFSINPMQNQTKTTDLLNNDSAGTIGASTDESYRGLERAVSLFHKTRSPLVR